MCISLLASSTSLKNQISHSWRSHFQLIIPISPISCHVPHLPIIRIHFEGWCYPILCNHHPHAPEHLEWTSTQHTPLKLPPPSQLSWQHANKPDHSSHRNQKPHYRNKYHQPHTNTKTCTTYTVQTRTTPTNLQIQTLPPRRRHTCIRHTKIIWAKT